jgi:predicted 3-demethylubiquinone-9 3-methyltransferase (glyoxalase superfamily)
MRCDTREELAEEFIPGNNFSISINTNNKEETDRLFMSLTIVCN